MSLSSRDLPRTSAAIARGIAEGLHLGAQVYVSELGGRVADLAWGESRPGVAMTNDSLNLWMSSGKPVAAVAIAQLWERGLLDLDDRVTRFIPEFGRNGKEGITLRHILTHTGGFRAPPSSQDAPWEQIIAELCAARLEPGWIPGRKAGYHAASSWYILGEIIRRTDGRDYSRYVREMIFEPLGMEDSWVGMPVERFEGYGDRVAVVPNTSGSGTAHDVRAMATSCRPGSSACGPIRELGRFYEMLRDRGRKGRVEAGASEASDFVGSALADGDFRSPRTFRTAKIASAEADHTRSKVTASSDGLIITPQSCEALTARHRAGMYDLTFKWAIDWGLGFLLNSPQVDAELPYGYGVQASPRTFGHGGAQSSGAFCDPERGLVVAYVFSGMPGEGRHHLRRKELVGAIYEDLGIGG